METLKINSWIDIFNDFPIEDKEYALDIIKRALAEARRDEILATAQQAELLFKSGSLKQGNLKSLMQDLDND